MAESNSIGSAIFDAMNIVECYGLLELKAGASRAEIKASYRRLARQYHPDANPQDGLAHAKFVKLHEAYTFLLGAVKPEGDVPLRSPTTSPPAPTPQSTAGTNPATKVSRKQPKFQDNPLLSEVEQLLKQKSYLQLQELLKSQRFPRVIALVEGLAQRIPDDREVSQWQAIAYQRWARHLIDGNQLQKARIYLKKALKTDPHNRSLWEEVKREFYRMEQIIR